MLKRLWRFIWGAPDPDRMADLIERMLDAQERGQKQMLDVVQEIGLASQKQAEVLGKYLDLFSPKAGDAEPQRWEEDPEGDTLSRMVTLGFNKDASEKEQAEWVLKHIDKL